jgi:hypothetical protein
VVGLKEAFDQFFFLAFFVSFLIDFKKVHQKCHAKSLTLLRSILHLFDTFLSILSHSQNIKGKLINNRTTKNDEAFFLPLSLDCFFL